MRDVIAGAGDAGAVGGLAHVIKPGPTLVERLSRLGQATLQEDGDRGQLGVVVGREVRPDLGAVDRHLVLELEDEGAVLAQRGLAADLDGRVDAVKIAVIRIVLVPLLVAVVGLVGAVADVDVIERLIGGFAHSRGNRRVVDDLLAVAVVLRQALDARGLVVLLIEAGITVPLVALAPLVALVAADDMRLAVGVDRVEREVDVGALVQRVLDVVVVPAREEDNVLRAGPGVREAVGLLVVVLQVGVELGAVARAGLGVVGAGVDLLGGREAVREALVVVLGETADGETAGVLIRDHDLELGREAILVAQHIDSKVLIVLGVDVERVGDLAAGDRGKHVAIGVRAEDRVLLAVGRAAGKHVVGGRALAGIGALIDPLLGERDVDQAHARVLGHDLRALEVCLDGVADVVDVAARRVARALVGHEALGAVGPRRERGVGVVVASVALADDGVVVVRNLAHTVVEALAAARGKAVANGLAGSKVHATAGRDADLAVPEVAVGELHGAEDVAFASDLLAAGSDDVGRGVDLDGHASAAGGVAAVVPLLGQAHERALAVADRVGDLVVVDDALAGLAVRAVEGVLVGVGLERRGGGEAGRDLLDGLVLVLGAVLVVLGQPVEIKRPRRGLAVLELRAVGRLGLFPLRAGDAGHGEPGRVLGLVLVKGDAQRLGDGDEARGAVGVLDLELLSGLDVRDALAVDVPDLGHAGVGVVHVAVGDGLVREGVAVLLGGIGALEGDGVLEALLVKELQGGGARDAGKVALGVGGELALAVLLNVDLAPLVDVLVAEHVVLLVAGAHGLAHVAGAPAGKLDGVADVLPLVGHRVQAGLGIDALAVDLAVGIDAAALKLHDDGDVLELILVGARVPLLTELGRDGADAHVGDRAAVVDVDVVLVRVVLVGLDLAPVAVLERGRVVLGLVVGDARGALGIGGLGNDAGDALVAGDGVLAQEVDVGVAVRVVLGERAVAGDIAGEVDAVGIGLVVILRLNGELDVLAARVGDLRRGGRASAVGVVAVERVGGLGTVGRVLVVPVLDGAEGRRAVVGKAHGAAAVDRSGVRGVVRHARVGIDDLVTVEGAVALLRHGEAVRVERHLVVEDGVVGVVGGLARLDGQRPAAVVLDLRAGEKLRGVGGDGIPVLLDGDGAARAELARVPGVDGPELGHVERAVEQRDVEDHVGQQLVAVDVRVVPVIGGVERAVVVALRELAVAVDGDVVVLDDPGDGVVGGRVAVLVRELGRQRGGARHVLADRGRGVDRDADGGGLLGGEAQLAVDVGVRGAELGLGDDLFVAVIHGEVELIAALERVGARAVGGGVVREDCGEARRALEVARGVRGGSVLGDHLGLRGIVDDGLLDLAEFLDGLHEPEPVGELRLCRDGELGLAAGLLLKDPLDYGGLVGDLGGVELGVELDRDVQAGGKALAHELEGELTLPHHGLGDLGVGRVAVGVGLIDVEDLPAVDVAQRVGSEVGGHALGKRDLEGVAREEDVVLRVAVAAAGGRRVERRLDAEDDGQRLGELDSGRVGRGDAVGGRVLVALAGDDGGHVLGDLLGELAHGVLVEGEAVGGEHEVVRGVIPGAGSGRRLVLGLLGVGLLVGGVLLVGLLHGGLLGRGVLVSDLLVGRGLLVGLLTGGLLGARGRGLAGALVARGVLRGVARSGLGRLLLVGVPAGRVRGLALVGLRDGVVRAGHLRGDDGVGDARQLLGDGRGGAVAEEQLRGEDERERARRASPQPLEQGLAVNAFLIPWQHGRSFPSAVILNLRIQIQLYYFSWLKRPSSHNYWLFHLRFRDQLKQKPSTVRIAPATYGRAILQNTPLRPPLAEMVPAHGCRPETPNQQQQREPRPDNDGCSNGIEKSAPLTTVTAMNRYCDRRQRGG